MKVAKKMRKRGGETTKNEKWKNDAGGDNITKNVRSNRQQTDQDDEKRKNQRGNSENR